MAVADTRWRRVVGWLLVAWVVPGCTAPRTPDSAASEHYPADAARWSEPGTTQVAVVGAGIAGLVTAYELEKRGIRTHVLEMEARVGGRVGTAEYAGGLRGEIGLHELWEGNPLLEIAAELGVEVDDGEAAYSSVLLDGVVRPFVQDTPDAFLDSFLTREERAELDAWMGTVADLLRRADTAGLRDPEIAALQAVSFDDWLASCELPDRAAQFVRLTLSSELGADPSRFSALFGLLEFRIFVSPGVPNHHVRGGNGRLVEALAEHLEGPVTLNARVTSVRREGGLASGAPARVTFEQDLRTRVLEADRVVLAVPWLSLHRILIEPPLPDETWRAVDLGMGRFAVVHLVMDAEARDLWLVDGASPMPILTDGPLGVIYGDVDNNGDALLFSLLVQGEHARAFHGSPHEARVRELIAELDEMWPGFARHVRESHVQTYHPAAVALWPPGRSPLDAGSERVRAPTEGVYLAGDWTYGAHSDGAARRGREIAAAIAAELLPAP